MGEYMNIRTQLSVVMLVFLGIVAPIKADKNVSAGSIKELASISQASALNIRFVESFSIMRECERGAECAKILDAKREQLTKELAKAEQAYTQKVTEFQAKGATLSIAAREKEEKELRRMEIDLKAKAQESDYEMKLAMQKITEELAHNMEAVIISYAEKNNLDAVVDTITGKVLYVKPALNISKAMVKEMNTDHQIRLAQSKKAPATAVAATPAAKQAAKA
jgi:Skp family chaperone for outer membrane proteins